MNMELLHEYVKTRSIEVRNKIVEENIPLVKFVVTKVYHKGFGEYEYNDLVNYGVFGLIKAVERYDITMGLKFSTYAYQKIYYSIIDELRKVDWVPRSIRYKIKLIQQDAKVLESTFGYEVDISSLAKDQGLSYRDMFVMEGTYMTSTDLPIYYAIDNREEKYDYVLR